MTPDEITRQIELIAASEANALGIRISTDAITRLAAVPPNFMGDMARIDVQISELRRTIREILDHASTFRRPVVDETLISSILLSWPCHYLWFC